MPRKSGLDAVFGSAGTSALVPVPSPDDDEQPQNGYGPVDEPDDGESVSRVLVADGRENDSSEESPDYEARRLAAFDAMTKALEMPLDAALVKQRIGPAGKKLDYLEWSTTVRQLNRIFGYGGWAFEVKGITDVGTGEDGIPRAVRAHVSLTVTMPGLRYWDTNIFEGVGFGAQESHRQGWKPSWQGYEMALKGAVNDGLKTASTKLGRQFGLDLYSKGDDEQSFDEQPQQSESRPRGQVRVHEEDTSSQYFECEECGTEIRGYTSKTNGRTYTAAQLAEFSKRDCDGRVLCYTHKQEYRKNQG